MPLGKQERDSPVWSMRPVMLFANGFSIIVHFRGTVVDAKRPMQMGRASRALIEQCYGVEKVVSTDLEALAQLVGEARVKVIDVPKTPQIK